MKHFWLNNGEMDAEGFYVAQVQDDDGTVRSTFKGTSFREVADKLLASNAHATAQIGELQRNRTPDRAPVAPVVGKPRALSADEKFRLSQQLQDPATIDTAVDELIEARTGMKPEALHQKTAADIDREQAEYIKAQTGLFLSRNPDYVKDDGNQVKMLAEMRRRNYDYTANNLQLVYDSLKSEGQLLISAAADGEEQQQQQGNQEADNPPNRGSEPNPPRQHARPRQTSLATGMRSSDSSASRPAPQPAQGSLTRAQLAAMPREEYHERYRDPQFRKQVDALGR